MVKGDDSGGEKEKGERAWDEQIEAIIHQSKRTDTACSEETWSIKVHTSTLYTFYCLCIIFVLPVQYGVVNILKSFYLIMFILMDMHESDHMNLSAIWEIVGMDHRRVIH